MKISTTVYDNDAHAAELATLVKEQHALQEFEDADAISFWLHHNHYNPRLKITTNEKGDSITVMYKAKKILSIDTY